VHEPHALPPVPQLRLLWLEKGSHVVALLQQPMAPQLAVVHTHWLAEQVVPAAHLLLHAPQLFESVVVSMHVPPQLE
jgi:hypothetical protein